MPEKSSAFRMNFDAESGFFDIRTDSSVLKRLVRDISVYMPLLLLFSAVSVLFAFTFVKIPQLLGSIIDIFASAIISSVIKGTESFDKALLVKQLSVAVLFLIMNALFSVLQGIISTDISSGYSASLRNRIFVKIGKIKVPYFDIHSKEHVMSLATEYTDSISQNLNIIFSQVFSSFIFYAAVTAALFRKDAVIGFCACILFLIQIIFDNAAKLKRDNGKSSRSRRNTASIPELYRDFGCVKLSGKAGTVMLNIQADEKDKAKRIGSERFKSFIIQNFPELLAGIALALTAALEYQKINDYAMSVGTFISIIIYFRKLAKPLSQIASFSQSSAVLLSVSEKIFSFLDWEEENVSEKTGPDAGADSALEVKNITFRYAGGTKNIFENFSTKIPPCGITVIRGLTGNGKTTLIKLILGMYEPNCGEILFNGKNISEYDIKKYRELFGVINQEASLFEKSIDENIAYPCEKADREKVYEAAKQSGAYGFINRLPQKYCTAFSSDPQNISDGQIQQILLARALYHEKKFIILDEATSFIDDESEKRLYGILKDVSANHGIIIITHKKNNIDFADRVIEI